MKANIEVDLKGIRVYVLTEAQQDLKTMGFNITGAYVYGSRVEAEAVVDKDIAHYEKSYGKEYVTATSEPGYYKVVTLCIPDSPLGAFTAKIYYKIAETYLHQTNFVI